MLTIIGIAGWADSLYVVPPGTPDVIPASPYNTWTNAATNIGVAINAASDNDTVWVSNGTYYAQPMNIGKAITIRSLPEYGAEQTILDGGYPDLSNLVANIYHADAVLDGFTITRSYYSTEGGGIRISAAGGTVQNCIIVSNFAGSAGGANLAGSAGAAYLRNCRIIQNSAGTGGGIRVRGTNVFILDCEISSNTASSTIGGIYFDSGMVTLVSNCDRPYTDSAGWAGGVQGGLLMHSRIIGNTAGTFAGGCSSSVLIDCIVASNVSGTTAGGLYGGFADRCMFLNNQSGLGAGIYGKPAVSNSTIRGNIALTNGGGVRLDAGGLLYNCHIDGNSSVTAGGVYGRDGGTLRNCLITGNTATYAGGVYMYRIHYNLGSIDACTIVSNYASDTGGGLYIITAYTNVTDNIIYSNAAGVSSPDIYALAASNAFSYCCADFNSFPPDKGNLTDNPLFVDAAAGNYRLRRESPCINAATNHPWMAGALDMDGRRRVRDGAPDIGCYEYIPAGMMFFIH